MKQFVGNPPPHFLCCANNLSEPASRVNGRDFSRANQLPKSLSGLSPWILSLFSKNFRRLKWPYFRLTIQRILPRLSIRIFLAIFLLRGDALQGQQHGSRSSDLLFVKANSTLALREAALELKRNPHDLNAWFTRMEAARVQLRSRDELHAATALLSKSRGEDSRAQLAAERVRELAANTPVFRRIIPELAALIRAGNPYSRQLTDALLTAKADGAPLPRPLHLTSRITRWQIAGPFGEFSNIDFDRDWPAEHDILRSVRYGRLIREDLRTPDLGKLELPEYFPRSGIYYAVADLPIPESGKYRLTVESEGTYSLTLDTKQLLLHDSRLTQQPAIACVDAELKTGTHRLLLKFESSATPVRVWFEESGRESPTELALPEIERVYLNAASALASDDVMPALSFPGRSSVADLLRADAVARLGEEQEAHELRESAVASDPNNLQARFEIAVQAFADEDFEQAATHLHQVLDHAPAYWPAQELKYQLADHFGWPQERHEALLSRLQLHPTCSALQDAIKYYNESSNAPQAGRYKARLATCAPVPYRYWEQLSADGHHREALADITQYLESHRKDRRTLTIALREAVLAGDSSKAHYGKALAERAPNWGWAERLASHPEAILDSPSASSPGEFYKPFVRDAVQAMQSGQAADQVLIDDRVVSLSASGDAWIYQHTATQVSDKRGIELAGEVEVPHSADVLVLRTLKRDGSVVEPETNDNKSTVSMPSLAPGDVVEIAFIQHFTAESLRVAPEQLDFTFGSADFPTRSARLTLIRAGAPEPLLWRSSGLAQIGKKEESGSEITTWEFANTIPASREPASPKYEREPRILFLDMDRVQPLNALARYRNELIQATKITPRIVELAATIQRSSAEQRTAAAYQYVIASLEADSQNWREESIASADESFAQGEGNRATALIALLSAMGFEADLELAAERGHYDPAEGCRALRCYTHPLVRVTLPSKKRIILDPQMDGAAAGALSPDVEGERALLVSRSDRSSSTEPVIVPRLTNQQSVATADLNLDLDGSMSGSIRVRFGSLRGAQMRESLRQLSAQDRQAYFEEIAGRILSNANTVSGMVRNEDDPELPLELELTVAASALPNWHGSELDIGQIVPALGLSRLYSTLPERREELLLEVPLVESSEFVLHLPAGVEASRLPNAAYLKTNFGEYRASFKLIGRDLHLIRSFNIPAQEIAPASYPAFAQFAAQIDNSERELIRLTRETASTTAPSR